MSIIREDLVAKILARTAHSLAGWQKTLPPGQLSEAMIYAIESGGKRVRPVCLGAMSLIGPKPSENFGAAAAALEMIHTFSLIHDDLPCMDNDDLRRGLPTVHRKFNESTALLAGDCLLAEAFAWVADKYPAEDALVITKELARVSGAQGLGYGQYLDLETEHPTEQAIRRIHEFKTARLFEAAFAIGGYLGGGSAESGRHMGRLVGMIFQAVDDVLDAEVKQESSNWAQLVGVAKVKESIDRDFVALESFWEEIPAGEGKEIFRKYVLALMDRKE